MDRFDPGAFGIALDHLTPVDRSQQGVGSTVIYKLRPAPPGRSIFLPKL